MTQLVTHKLCLFNSVTWVYQNQNRPVITKTNPLLPRNLTSAVKSCLQRCVAMCHLCSLHKPGCSLKLHTLKPLFIDGRIPMWPALASSVCTLLHARPTSSCENKSTRQEQTGAGRLKNRACVYFWAGPPTPFLWILSPTSSSWTFSCHFFENVIAPAFNSGTSPPSSRGENGNGARISRDSRDEGYIYCFGGAFTQVRGPKPPPGDY